MARPQVMLGTEARAIQRSARVAVQRVSGGVQAQSAPTHGGHQRSPRSAHGVPMEFAVFSAAMSPWAQTGAIHVAERALFGKPDGMLSPVRVDLFEMPEAVRPQALFQGLATLGITPGALEADHHAIVADAHVALKRPTNGMDWLIDRGIEAITNVETPLPYADAVIASGQFAVQVRMKAPDWETVAEALFPVIRRGARFAGHDYPRNPVGNLLPGHGEWVHLDFADDAVAIARGWPLGRDPQTDAHTYRMVVRAVDWATGYEIFVSGPTSDGAIGVERARIVMQGLLSLVE